MKLLEQIRECSNFGACPFCNRLAFSKWHRCAVLEQMSKADAVRTVSAKVREILRDEPADKFVHVAYDAMDHLERAFPREERDVE